MFIESTNPPIDLSGINHRYYENIQYRKTNREVMDIFIPTDPVTPTGICIYLHAGGFYFWDKSRIYDASGEAFIQNLLSNGYAFASMNYDYIQTIKERIGIIDPITRASVAIQFLKYYADFFNLNKDKFVLYGSSAGAGIAMWIGYQPDFSDPLSENVILREDTTVGAISIRIPQSTYDIIRWETEIFSHLGYSLLLDIQNNPQNFTSLKRTYGIYNYGDLFIEEVVAERKTLDMLQMIQLNGGIPTYINCPSVLEDVLVNYTLSDINHSPYHAKAIKDYLDLQGTENVSYITNLGITDPSGETNVDFLKRKMDEL